MSYVLNDSKKVRPETEQRVLWAARDLGYLPNSAARSLAVGHSSIFGLIVPDISNPFFPEITKAFQAEAARYGMETVVMDGNTDPQRTHTMVERFLGLQVPGIAFLTSQVDATVKDFIARRGLCATYLGFGSAAPKIANIAIEQPNGIRDAVNHLAALGHRRVGFIAGPVDGVFAARRKAAFLTAAGAVDMETRVYDSDLTVQGGYFGCSRVLSGFPATAVMAGNDLMAIGALHYAYDRQIAVPAALSVIGFDDITFAQFTQPALTTVAVPRVEIGRLAVESLWNMIHNGAHGTDYEVRSSLVIRQSTGRAQGA